MVNNCHEQIRVGATGGFVKRLAYPEEESCPDGSVLDAAVSMQTLLQPPPPRTRAFDIS